MECDLAEEIGRTAFSTDTRKTSLSNLLQAGGQLEAHYRRVCPCFGFPPVERIPVPEPIVDKAKAPKRPFVHGANGYRNHKCRCDVCRDGNRLNSAKYRPKSDNLKIRLDATPLIRKLTLDGRLEAVDNSKLTIWRRTGIDLYAADRWCIRLGYHPIEIWGQEFYLGAADGGQNG
jgi:hypothetical protein